MCESVTVIVIDDHNGLYDPKSRKCMGLNASGGAPYEVEKARRAQVLKQYCDFSSRSLRTSPGYASAILHVLSDATGPEVAAGLLFARWGVHTFRMLPG